MRWRKRGIIFCPYGSAAWARTGAMIPTPIRMGSAIRVYFTSLDADGLGRPGFVDLAGDDPTRVIAAGDEACLDIGLPGTFDENGVLACSIVAANGQLWMYYAGFERGTRIRYRLLSGLAASEDGGRTFVRVTQTPVLERSPAELYFRGGPHVFHDGGRFRMWYVAGSSWTDVGGKQMPEYAIKYLESRDGRAWPGEGRPCIDVEDADEHGFGRPWVVRDASGGYEMFYSIRRRSLGAYRLGYATSADGLAWKRLDSRLGLDVSASGFDSKAIMYAAVVDVDGRRYCFYNGDDFGREGIALAELVER